MLLLALLLCLCPPGLGQLEDRDPADLDPADLDPAHWDPADWDPADWDPADWDPADWDPADPDLADPDLADPDLADPDLADLDLDIAPRRIPRQVKTMLTKETKPHIQELSIKTTVISRYAFTAVYCAMLNRHSAAAEAAFHFRVPANAYVSNFTMIIGGRVYQSEVRPKEKKVKQENGRGNKGSGDPSPEPEVEVFRMAASVPGRNRAVFLLTYEELLQRRLGRYELLTSLRPQQLVGRLRLDVVIVDHAPLAHLQVLPLRSGRTTTPGKAELPVATTIRNEKNVCRITFNPNIIQQARISTNGMLGDFVIRYDVQRDLGIGDIQVLNGHFVHYFAPRDLPVVPKNVVFVIDTSASMLGTKIRQTKDALFTILRDLRPADRFNLVSFSNKIKVWQPGRLVPVTPLSVRDAKKFIFTLPTTGGTNIDEAMQAGAALLRDFLSGPDAGPNSVSLIVFLTDGRPTVGEVQSNAILGNTRSAVQEKFCVFTIGLGADVDYGLLERMALENCGMTRRIREEADAGAMLKGFYQEIGTPLLSDVRLSYSEVDYVTQQLFTNYFNGSEIVVAGKLTNQSAESLHVVVTASSSDRSVVLETDVPLRRRQLETQKHVNAAAAAMATGATAPGAKPPGAGPAQGAGPPQGPGIAKPPGAGLGQGAGPAQPPGGATAPAASDFVERVWGFLSVKEGLKARLRSQSSRQRDDVTRQTTNLSLTYHFHTPLTSLLVEKPEVLADGTMATAPTIAPATGEADSAANELPGDAEDGQTQKPGRETPPPNNAIAVRRPAHKSVSVSRTSADGDPHFVVEFPQSKLTVCFNINGSPGDVLLLVSDHRHSGVTVNGRLIGAPPPPGSRKQQRTYFSSITVVTERPRRAYIEVTPTKVILDGLDRMVLPCHATAAVDSGVLSVSIAAEANVTVTVGGNISFVILLHRYKNPAPFQRNHLGFYIGQSKGLSASVHGLLGQFLYADVGLVKNPSAHLKLKNRLVPVVQKNRRLFGGTQSVDCWFARSHAHLIDGRYQDYLSAHAFDMGSSAHASDAV